ncbi:hypothetical protein BC629DRAFT_1727780, partial [Irpex lacteus]
MAILLVYTCPMKGDYMYGTIEGGRRDRTVGHTMQDKSSVGLLSLQTSRRELQALSDDELNILNNLQHAGFTPVKSRSSPPDLSSSPSTSTSNSTSTKQPRNSQ